MKLPALACALVTAACGDAPPPLHEPDQRVLVIGWDGASFRHIDPLLAAGRMPALAGLIDRGVRGPLRSTIIPISSAAWTAAVTGRNPGETGVYSFFAPVEGSYELRLVDSRTSRAAPLWRILTRRGRRSIVFGVPLTYPPEPLLGTLVAGMLSPFDADYAWPPGTAEALRARGFVPDLESWREDWDATWGDLETQLALKEEVVGELLDKGGWSLAFVVFKSLDVLAHKSYGEDFQSHVTPLYELLDAALGRLLARVGPETDVLLVSDHGFHSYVRGFNLHAWLIAEGFATRRPDASPVRSDHGVLAERMKEELADLLGELDLARTNAFAMRCEGNFGSVRLNLAGREPQGPVATEDADAALRALEERLATHPRVVSVWRTSELYPGPHRQALPDLVFETEPDVQVFTERGQRVFGDYTIPIPDHDRLGILVAAGPSFRRRAEPAEEARDLVDLAPTVLHLLGEAVPVEMDGRVPFEWLRIDRPVTTAPSGPVEGPGPDDERAYTPAELEELERRLRALGYGE